MEKIRFGIVGTGEITEKILAGAAQNPYFEACAVYSRTWERADLFAGKYHIPHTFTSLEEMVEQPYIDAVYIASPNFRHADQSILCMEHGKHVLCEKPLASNAREARAMISAARKNGVALMEAMRTTLSPNFNILQNHIGRAGKIRRYFSSYCQYSSRYDRFKQGIILNAFRPELSNGAIMDIGVYTLYPLIALFGRPEKITASGLLLSTGADGQGTALLEYGDMNATVIYSKIADSCLPTEIQGEEGNILISRINDFSSLSFVPHTHPTSGYGLPAEAVNISCKIDHDYYYYEVTEFIRMIHSGKKESQTNSWENSLATLECTDEIRHQIGVIFPSDNY